MTSFGVGLRADDVPAADAGRDPGPSDPGAPDAGSAARGGAGAGGGPCGAAGAGCDAGAGGGVRFPDAFALGVPAAAAFGGRGDAGADAAPGPAVPAAVRAVPRGSAPRAGASASARGPAGDPVGAGAGCAEPGSAGDGVRSAGRGPAVRDDRATGADAAAIGCPVFLAGVPIDEAGARWLTATARAARAGDPDAPLALWLALRPRFARWAAACLDRTSAADLRRDGAPWLFDDLLQEGYLVLLGVVADWPDRDGGAEPGAAVAPAGASGDDATGRAFLPWLFAVAPRRLYGALATLRDRAGRSRGAGAGAAPLSDADLLADGTAEAGEAAARLAAVAAALDPIDGALLLAHVADREPIALAGRRLGLDRGAAYHRWRRVRARLRDELTG